MYRTLAGLIVGALAALALIAPWPAAASTPPSVFVRIEGSGATLLPQTVVQTASATKLRGAACPGSSAQGALDAATEGIWAGSYSTKFNDFFDTTILGEASTGNNFWSLWINGRSSSTGGCSTALHPGDHELWFDCVAGANFNCTNNPLSIGAPAVTKLGRPVTATVTQLNGNGGGVAIAGAVITGNGVRGLSTSSGKAAFVPHEAGVIVLQARKSGASPSDPLFLCVYAHHRSECGAQNSSGPPARVTGIREHQVFAHGPRQLHGTAGPDPSGLTDVELSLRRHAPSGKCSYYDDLTATWHAVSCHATKPIPSFSVGANATWSFLLPAALAPGSYKLDVVASDGAGKQTKLVKGVSAIDFRVAKAGKP